MGMGGWDYQPYNVTFTLAYAKACATKPSSKLILIGIVVHNEVIAYPVFDMLSWW
jgi:hypothetical protein